MVGGRMGEFKRRGQAESPDTKPDEDKRFEEIGTAFDWQKVFCQHLRFVYNGVRAQMVLLLDSLTDIRS